MSYLEENLKTKKPLVFKNGKFRILTLSDLHGMADLDMRMVRDIDAIVEKQKPDLILLIGDIAWRDAAVNAKVVKEYLEKVIPVFESRKIPWAHVYGNHDAEDGMPNSELQKIYEEYEYCLSKAGPEDIHGTGNYVLPVYSKNGEIVYNVWGLDSNQNLDHILTECGLEKGHHQAQLPNPIFPSGGYDSVRFDQIMWYWNSSVELEKHCGRKIPGLMFFHIPLPEFHLTYLNESETGYKGIKREGVGCGPLNPGLFSAVFQRGDVKSIVCGHDHINDFEGTYLGVKMMMDAGISYNGYCDDDMRGGRVIDINEDDPWNIETFMVRASECVENYYEK